MSNSLFLSDGIAQRYGAPVDFVVFLKTKFPYGIFVNELFESAFIDVDMDFIHWMYINLPLTKLDKALYLEYVEIVNSNNFYNSYSITNCDTISDSLFCTDSFYIFDSSYVKDSSLIYNSEDIIGSHKIYYSYIVVDSCCVMDSDHITKGKKILTSKKIEASGNIAYSKSVGHSDFLVECEGIKNSQLSKNLKNCSNKLLCYDLINNDVPMILNEEVSQERLNQTVKSLMTKMQDYKVSFEMYLPDIIWDDLQDIEDKIRIINNTRFEVMETPKELLFKNLFDNNLVMELLKRHVPGADRDRLYELSFSDNCYKK